MNFGAFVFIFTQYFDGVRNVPLFRVNVFSQNCPTFQHPHIFVQGSNLQLGPSWLLGGRCPAQYLPSLTWEDQKGIQLSCIRENVLSHLPIPLIKKLGLPEWMDKFEVFFYFNLTELIVKNNKICFSEFFHNLSVTIPTIFFFSSSI